MSNQDRLLSDEELRKAISVYELQSIVPKGMHRYPDKLIITVGSLLSTPDIEGLVDLINTQKRLYAESVIGELENGANNIMDMPRELIRNELRAEQRARIK